MGTCGSTSNKDVKEPKKSKDKKDQDSKEDKKTKNVTLKKELPNKYLVISGPSGVGKGTIIKEIFAAYTDHTKFSVSYTTRGPRPGEENGKDYNFISDEEFVAEIEKGNFQEHVQFAGTRYGTNKQAIQGALDEGKICVLDVEINGSRMIKESGYPGILVFIKPPKFEELEARLKGRGTESEEKIQKRVNQAKEDQEKLEKDNFFTYTVVNDDLKIAVKEVQDLFEKEFCEEVKSKDKEKGKDKDKKNKKGKDKLNEIEKSKKQKKKDKKKQVAEKYDGELNTIDTEVKDQKAQKLALRKALAALRSEKDSSSEDTEKTNSLKHAIREKKAELFSLKAQLKESKKKSKDKHTEKDQDVEELDSELNKEEDKEREKLKGDIGNDEYQEALNNRIEKEQFKTKKKELKKE